MTDTATTEAPAAKPKSNMVVVCESVQAMTPKFAAALPAHIAPEKFVRTVLTTIQLNPDIADCDKGSIYNECIKAAADGLIIDGREAALVKYNVKKKVNGVDTWINAAKYMPMVAGLLKKARNSGEISSIVGRCVYANDKFTVIFGDDEKLTHEPCLEGEPGALRLAYMVAKLKDGTIVRHVMTRKQIEKRRDASKSKDSGPWKTWEDDMWIKTVLRGGSKFLPASSDKSGFNELVERDDDLYALNDDDMPPPSAQQQADTSDTGQRRTRARRGAGQSILDRAATVTDVDVETIDQETGEITTSQAPAAEPAQQQAPAAQPTPAAVVQPAPAATPAAQAAAPAPKPAPAGDGMDPPDLLRRTPPPAVAAAKVLVSEANPPPPTMDDVI